MYIRAGKTGSLGPWRKVKKGITFLHFYNTLHMTLRQGPKDPVLPTLSVMPEGEKHWGCH